jgi:ferredoxin
VIGISFVDKEKCAGCGICAGICPQGLEIIGGKARIRNKNAECLKNAADACPRGAIILGSDQKESDSEVKNTFFGQGFARGSEAGFGRGMGRGQGMGSGHGGGRGRMGGFAAGPSGNCACPNCGYKISHQRGQPCYQMKCPKCGSPMTRR